MPIGPPPPKIRVGFLSDSAIFPESDDTLLDSIVTKHSKSYIIIADVFSIFSKLNGTKGQQTCYRNRRRHSHARQTLRASGTVRLFPSLEQLLLQLLLLLIRVVRGRPRRECPTLAPSSARASASAPPRHRRRQIVPPSRLALTLWGPRSRRVPFAPGRRATPARSAATRRRRGRPADRATPGCVSGRRTTTPAVVLRCDVAFISSPWGWRTRQRRRSAAARWW
jgi:hypothetical protein